MIYKCEGCGEYLAVASVKCIVTAAGTEFYCADWDGGVPASAVKEGICPACALETICRIEMDDILHGVRIRDGRHNIS